MLNWGGITTPFSLSAFFLFFTISMRDIKRHKRHSGSQRTLSALEDYQYTTYKNFIFVILNLFSATNFLSYSHEFPVKSYQIAIISTWIFTWKTSKQTFLQSFWASAFGGFWNEFLMHLLTWSWWKEILTYWDECCKLLGVVFPCHRNPLQQRTFRTPIMS